MRNILLKSSLSIAVALSLSSNAFAMEPHNFSISMTGASFSSEIDANDNRTEMYGLDYALSNKLYATEGMIYKVNAFGSIGYYDIEDIARTGLGLEAGRRFAKENDTFIDVIGGINYENFDIENTDNDDQTYIDVPSLRAAFGAGKFIDSNSVVRVEMGVDYAIGANYDGGDIDEDIDGSSIYGEMTYANDKHAIPYHATLYYKDYGLDGDNSELDASEIGLKMGIHF